MTYDSPLEQTLHTALLKIVDSASALGFRLELQYTVPPYRLDFAFVASDGRKLCVEVDGYENHDKTKEQAQHDRRRDRVLLLSGWRVVRFTGSEVYNTAASCANEVLLHLKLLTAPTTGQAQLATSIAKAIIRLTKENATKSALEYQQTIETIFKIQGWQEVSPGKFKRADLVEVLTRKELILWLIAYAKTLGNRVCFSEKFKVWMFPAGYHRYVGLQIKEEYLDILDQLDAERAK